MKSLLKHAKGIMNYNFTTINAYSKLKVQRGPQQICLFQYQTKQLFQTVFEGSQIQIVQHRTPQDYRKRIGLIFDEGQKQLNSENEQFSINDQPLIQSLMSDFFSLVQVIPKTNEQITYGIQISRLSQTNNLNVLYQNMIATRLHSIGNTRSKRTMEIKLNSSSSTGSIVLSATRNNLALIETSNQLRVLRGYQIVRAIELAFKQCIFESWNEQAIDAICYNCENSELPFLFYITYGKYGWDVGEPVSYLSNLLVQLVAMIGLYDYQFRVQTKGIYQKNVYFAIHNISSRQKMLNFRLSQYWKRL